MARRQETRGRRVTETWCFREHLSKGRSFKQRFELSDGVSHMAISRESILDTWKSKCDCPKVGVFLVGSRSTVRSDSKWGRVGDEETAVAAARSWG